MDLATFRQQILSSNKTASGKAEAFLQKREVNEMSKAEWRELIAGIPEDVEREIGRLKSADPDLTARIAYLEEQQQLDGGLARKLYDNVFRYSESKISKSTNRKLKGRLIAAYGKTVQGKLVCMLTSEALLSETVIAAHLYKSSWAVFVDLALGFSDIDDVRNGLLLWKPIEHAFDTAQMCFTYDTQSNSFVAQILNSAILTEKLSSYGQRVMGPSWAAPSSVRAMTLTFADIDKVALSFPVGCEVRPYKRVLCYQAHLAQREAAKRGWKQINFDDF